MPAGSFRSLSQVDSFRSMMGYLHRALVDLGAQVNVLPGDYLENNGQAANWRCRRSSAAAYC